MAALMAFWTSGFRLLARVEVRLSCALQWHGPPVSACTQRPSRYMPDDHSIEDQIRQPLLTRPGERSLCQTSCGWYSEASLQQRRSLFTERNIGHMSNCNSLLLSRSTHQIPSVRI